MEAVVEKKCPSCRSMHVENTKCCVSCIVKAKARYDLKKEEILQKSKEDRIKNPDKYKQINKKKYENHKQEIQQKTKNIIRSIKKKYHNNGKNIIRNIKKKYHNNDKNITMNIKRK